MTNYAYGRKLPIDSKIPNHYNCTYDVQLKYKDCITFFNASMTHFDSITFVRTQISVHYLIGNGPFPELVLHLPDLTRTGVTAAQQAFTMRNQELMCVLSDA